MNFHSNSEFEGFDQLEDLLKDYADKASDDNVGRILEIGAKEMVSLLLKLPKPRSQIYAPGYTHLIDSFAYKMDKGQVLVGWGKYYGRMIEDGTVKQAAQPHMVPTFNKNKEMIYRKMINQFYKEG